MKDHEFKKQAYIDDQLPVEDVVDFEDTLTKTEKAELQKERHFEESLSTKLSLGPTCPEETWNKLKANIETDIRQQKHDPINFKLISLAAVIVISFGLIWTIASPNNRGFRKALKHASLDTDPKVFAKDADVPGDYQKIQSALSTADIHLSLNTNKATHHELKPLGMRILRQGKKNMAQMYFLCCKKPVMVLIAKRDHKPLSDILPQNSMRDHQIFTKIVDNYRITVIGVHSPQEVLDIFS